MHTIDIPDIKNKKIDSQEITTTTKNIKKDSFYSILKLREGKVILCTNVCVIFIFSLIYFFFGNEENWNGIDSESNLFDFFYFSFTTMTTIGYGDVSPKVVKTKIICIMQQLIVLFELANFFSNVIISKPIKFRFLKRSNKIKNTPSISKKIGRYRRSNSCQLDYSTSRRRLTQHHISIDENENDITFVLPLPPNNFSINN